MSHFGITQQGYQDPIREYMHHPEFSAQHLYRSGDFRCPHAIKFPPIIDITDRVHASVVPINQVSGYGPGPDGSYAEYTRLRQKHTRNPKEPCEIYRYPLVTSFEVARFRKDEPILQREPWMNVPRYGNVYNEMTRFVDTMAKTNREFSLF